MPATVGSRVRPRRAPTLSPKSTAAAPTLRSSVEPSPVIFENGSEGEYGPGMANAPGKVRDAWRRWRERRLQVATDRANYKSERRKADRKRNPKLPRNAGSAGG